MIFLGASMCVTALPIMARIIQFKKLANTTMGTVALGAGAINDAAAWCLLAVVLASLDGDLSHALMNIGGGMAYVCLVHLVVRPLLLGGPGALHGVTRCPTVSSWCAWSACRWARGSRTRSGYTQSLGPSSWATAMPRGLVARVLIERIQPLTVALLLPLFFTYSGLNTQIGLLDSSSLWLTAGLVLATAILGKGVACWLAARATGLNNREALGIGTLMNARGLMELIIINIGLQRGIISPALFATLVIMAVVTTLMTSPTSSGWWGGTSGCRSRGVRVHGEALWHDGGRLDETWR